MTGHEVTFNELAEGLSKLWELIAYLPDNMERNQLLEGIRDLRRHLRELEIKLTRGDSHKKRRVRMKQYKDAVGLLPLAVVLDTETTGLSAERNDVVQLAGIILQFGIEVQRFTFTCKPHRWDTITQEALDINGHTLEKLRGYEDPVSIGKKVKDILDSYNSTVGEDGTEEREPYQMIAHNMTFDYRFMAKWFEKNGFVDWGVYFLPPDECICTKKWGNRARKELGWAVPDGKLISFMAYFNFEFDAHDALGDTIACFHLMQKLVVTDVIMPKGGPSQKELQDEGKKTMDELEEIDVGFNAVL